jgi:cobalamin biosynthesis protein CbiD
MLSEKKKRKHKMCSKKWYLKRNISCDAHLLNELLETDVPCDDAIVVSAGKLRKLWDSLSELHSSVCERRLEKTVLRPALLPAKTAQFSQFFPSYVTSHSKIAQFN